MERHATIQAFGNYGDKADISGRRRHRIQGELRGRQDAQVWRGVAMKFLPDGEA